MDIYFNIDYQTTFGEQLILNVLEPDNKETTYRMSTNDGKLWWCGIVWKEKFGQASLQYYYTVEAQGTCLRRPLPLSRAHLWGSQRSERFHLEARCG